MFHELGGTKFIGFSPQKMADSEMGEVGLNLKRKIDELGSVSTKSNTLDEDIDVPYEREEEQEILSHIREEVQFLEQTCVKSVPERDDFRVRVIGWNKKRPMPSMARLQSFFGKHYFVVKEHQLLISFSSSERKNFWVQTAKIEFQYDDRNPDSKVILNIIGINRPGHTGENVGYPVMIKNIGRASRDEFIDSLKPYGKFSLQRYEEFWAWISFEKKEDRAKFMYSEYILKGEYPEVEFLYSETTHTLRFINAPYTASKEEIVKAFGGYEKGVTGIDIDYHYVTKASFGRGFIHVNGYETARGIIERAFNEKISVKGRKLAVFALRKPYKKRNEPKKGKNNNKEGKKTQSMSNSTNTITRNRIESVEKNKIDLTSNNSFPEINSNNEKIPKKVVVNQNQWIKPPLIQGIKNKYVNIGIDNNLSLEQLVSQRLEQMSLLEQLQVIPKLISVAINNLSVAMTAIVGNGINMQQQQQQQNSQQQADIITSPKVTKKKVSINEKANTTQSKEVVSKNQPLQKTGNEGKEKKKEKSKVQVTTIIAPMEQEKNVTTNVKDKTVTFTIDDTAAGRFFQTMAGSNQEVRMKHIDALISYERDFNGFQNFLANREVYEKFLKYGEEFQKFLFIQQQQQIGSQISDVQSIQYVQSPQNQQ